MEWVDVIIISLVQGFTEFLPISAAAHLQLASEWLQLDLVNRLALDAAGHFAAALAVAIYFRSDIWNLLQVLMRKLGKLPVNERDITLLNALALGSLPIAILGMLVDSYILENFQSILMVAVILFLSSVFFMYTEWRYYLRPVHVELTIKNAWLIGLFQILALIPAVSRTGITIVGGMWLGLTRQEAVRFSFLLALPAMLGIGIKKTMNLLSETSGSIEWTMVGGGALLSFFVSLIVMHLFIKYTRRNTLWPFAWYGIILAGMMWYVEYFT